MSLRKYIAEVDWDFQTKNKSLTDKGIENFEFKDAFDEAKETHGRENVKYECDRENNKMKFYLVESK